MSLDARKRQKKAEQRKKKERSKQRALAAKTPRGWKERLERVARSPILHCLKTGKSGMHQLLLSRECSNGTIAYAIFLVDIWCLGVKNVAFDILPAGTYEDKIHDRFLQIDRAHRLRPEAARKFVEGAVAYAQSLGFSPHADYAKACVLFGEIDAAAATEEFKYGKDGKPYYFAGPNESFWKSKLIIDALAQTCGEGNFNHTIHLTEEEFNKLDFVKERGGSNAFDWQAADETNEDDFEDEHAEMNVIDVNHHEA